MFGHHVGSKSPLAQTISWESMATLTNSPQVVKHWNLWVMGPLSFPLVQFFLSKTLAPGCGSWGTMKAELECGEGDHRLVREVSLGPSP